MNLRTLKKLSKRAAPLLPLLGDDREQFRAERGDNYHGAFIGDRKHWERGRCHPTYEGRNDWTTARGAEIVFLTRTGRHIVLGPPSHPRKGTIMVGATSGYYEPEWDEECAYVALEKIVYGHFTCWDVAFLDCDVDELPDTLPLMIRELSSPSLIFAAAADIIKERQNG